MKTYQRYTLTLLFFLLLSSLVFRAGWGQDAVFAASDANAGQIAQIKNLLPDAFFGSYSSVPLFGSVINRAVSARNLLIWLLPVQMLSDLIYLFWLIISSMALMAYLRLWKCSWISSLVGTLAAFWVGSITLCSSGHINKPAVAAFFVLSLFLLEKCLRATSVRQSSGYALLCGGSTGFMLLEQQDVGLYFAVLLGPYVLLRLIQRAGTNWKIWLRTASAIVVTALLICSAPALKAYGKNVSDVDGGQQTSAEKWNFITQWSFPPAEWPDLVAPGYTGWSSGNSKGPYWGVMGQSADWKKTGKGFRNFRLDSLYIGAIPLLLALAGWAVASGRLKRRDETAVVMFFWGVAALTVFLLSMGKFSPLYNLFYHLPLVNNVRAPVKFMHNLQIVIGILASFGLTAFLNEEMRRKSVLKWMPVGFCAAGLMMLAMAGSSSLGARFAAWGQYSGVIVENIRRSWLHGGLMALLLGGGLIVLAWKNKVVIGMMIPLLFAAAVVFDSLYLTSEYFHSDDFKGLRSGNPVITYLKEHQDEQRVFLFSTDRVYNQWLAQDFPYHQIHAFNIWQMPRMSAENRQFLSTVGRDWKKMIDMASVGYALAPAGVWQKIQHVPGMVADFEPVMAYRFAMSGKRVVVQTIPQATQPSDQVLLKVKSSLPRMALFSDWSVAAPGSVFKRMASPEFDPRARVIISGAPDVAKGFDSKPGVFQTLETIHITPRGAEGRVVSDDGGVVLFTQYVEPGWTVFVDGRPGELLRCNGLSMGVFVPAGEHVVRFAAPQDRLGAAIQVAGMLLGLSGLFFIPVYRK